MKIRYGTERWQAVGGVVMSTVIAFALMGAAPLAFAEGEGVGSDAKVPASEEDDEGSLDAAFRLGDVAMSCLPQNEGADDGLAVGVPSTRTYLITNEGERAYVRLASELIFGELAHANESSVSELAVEEPDTADPGDGDAEDGEEDEALARLASSTDASDSDEENAEGAEDAPDPETVAWQLAEDGWWYRSEPLEAGESILVSVAVEIPFADEWVQALSTGEPSDVKESIRVEAVQARNMAIDLAAEEPWGGLTVEIPETVAPEDEVTGGDEEVERS